MTEKQRRIAMTIAGVLISGFSVGIFNFSLFGMDPFQVLAHGLWNLSSIGYGTFYMIINLVMLIGIFFFKEPASWGRIFFIFTLICSIVGLKLVSH